MKPVFVARKYHRTTAVIKVGGFCRLDHSIFTPACQYLPGFKIIPPRPPAEWTWQGKWYTIDF